MLRLYALFLLCKFPDASAQLEAFQKQYRPQQSDLLGVTAYTKADAFDQIRRHIADGTSDLPKMVTLAFENEDRIKDSIGAITSAEQEIARLKNVGANVFAQSAMDWVNARRTEVIESEGARILKRVKKMETDLSEMLANSDVTKLDLLQMESRLFERASYTGKLPEAKRRVKRQVRARVTERKWDWQGEFWADEVGYYRVDTTPECPANMMQGG